MGFILSFKMKIAALAFLFGAVIPAISFYITTSTSKWGSTWITIICGMLFLISGGVSLVFAWILTLRTSPYQSLKKGLLHLVVSMATALRSRSVMPKFLDTLQRPGHFQERLLMDIIRANEGTAYGKEHCFRNIKSVADFRKQHPLTTYEHFRQYVERTMDGEEEVMTKAKTKSFARTSGTTGKPKFIPHVDRLDLLMDLSALTRAAAKEAIPELGPLQKRLQFYVSPVLSRTKSGIMIEMALTIPSDNALITSVFSTPPAGFTIETLFEANYIALLFALRDKNIGIISCNFLAFVERMMQQLEQCWADIIHDIEYGTVNTSLTLDVGVRAELEKEMKGQGDPARAKELRDEFENGFDAIIPRVWPHLQIVLGVDPGNVRARLAKAYTGDILLYSYVIGASEGVIAFNPWPLNQDLGYVPTFLHNFYEFIPEQDTDQAQPATLMPEELEVGQRYEIVITTNAGLCRYRMGDVIKVNRFEHKTPVFEFSYRKGQMLNLYYEKLDQSAVSSAIKAVVSRWSNVELYEYAVAQSTLMAQPGGGGSAPYYLFFIELKGDTTSLITDKQKATIDEELRAHNVDFNKLQKDGAIAPSRIHIVRPGAFTALQEHCVKGGAAQIQYKVPNKLVKTELVDVLMKHAIHSGA